MRILIAVIIAFVLLSDASLAQEGKAFGATSFMLNEYLATAHAGKDGMAELARDETRVADHNWPYPVFGYLLGRIDDTALLRAAADEWQKCGAKYFIGEKLLLAGKVELANLRFKDVAQTCPYPIEPAWRSQWYTLQAGQKK